MHIMQDTYLDFHKLIKRKLAGSNNQVKFSVFLTVGFSFFYFGWKIMIEVADAVACLQLSFAISISDDRICFWVYNDLHMVI